MSERVVYQPIVGGSMTAGMCMCVCRAVVVARLSGAGSVCAWWYRSLLLRLYICVRNFACAHVVAAEAKKVFFKKLAYGKSFGETFRKVCAALPAPTVTSNGHKDSYVA